MKNEKVTARKAKCSKIVLKCLIEGTLIMWCVVTASGQTFWEGVSATADAMREHAEQSQADASIRTIFAKAEAKEEDGAINFCGFYTGMAMADAETLAAHYGLKDGEGTFEENAGTHEVYSMHFSLHGVRRITKGGNSFDELAQAVANRVGSMQHKGGWGEPGWYEYKTIDGVTVKMDQRNGCHIHDAPRAEAAERAQQEVEQAMARAAMVAALGKGAHAGESRVVTLPGGVVMEMVWCPPGSFMMGSNDGDSDEKPVHNVTLTTGFWMAKTEVTQTQWKSVMWNNPSFHEGDMPVENVSWNDCQQFCQKAGLSLPTEAEWEYACRAGSTGAYGGTGKLENMGWYDGNSGSSTHPAGQKQPNAWGLYDMHGNVNEWCADWYGDYPSGAVTNPKGAASGDYRVLRGGSFRSLASNCRSSIRRWDPPGHGYDGYGFRPVARQE